MQYDYEDEWEWNDNTLFKNGKRIAHIEPYNQKLGMWKSYVGDSLIGESRYHLDAKKLIKNKLAEHSVKLGIVLTSTMYIN